MDIYLNNQKIFMFLLTETTFTCSVFINRNTLSFLKAVTEGGSKIYGGFGISNGEQAKKLAESVVAIVAGSVFVNLITANQNDKDSLYNAVFNKAEELTSIN